MRAILALLLILPFAAQAQAPVVQTAEAKACLALIQRDFTALPDAPTSLYNVEVVAAERDLPAYCRAQGTISPRITFEVRLPLAAWNGKFLMQGCGGMCGILNMAAAEDSLVRNYAVVNTDMGHTGNAGIASWAYNDRAAEIDFGYRATHVVAEAAKAVVAAYYGKAPTTSYFNGCSTGGRQAFLEAQRFPEDFDGIVGGAPVLDETGDAMLHLWWSARANLDANNKPILDSKKLVMVRKSIMDACDMLDGVKDGFMQNPRACTWKPEQLACKGKAGDACLTTAEIGVLQRIYGGAHDSKGKRIYAGGMELGSEYEWAPGFVDTNGKAGAIVQPLLEKAGGMPGMIAQMGQFMVFFNDPGPGYDPLKFDFDRDPKRLALMEVLFNAQNPDLRKFKAAGGKFIAFHGWDDMEIPPSLTLDYYDMVTRLMGGVEKTQEVMRLFMIPGMAHCRRGPGADTIDTLTAIENWVEKGQAPETLLAIKTVKPQSYGGLPRPRFPLAKEAVALTRPVPVWPNTATWSGQGDPNDAATWTIVRGTP